MPSISYFRDGQVIDIHDHDAIGPGRWQRR